jgi:hypothetical protein
LDQITGPIAARSSTGGIDASDLNGAARLSTRTGDIRITGDNRQLTVRSQSGDIALDASVVDHTTLETDKGRLEIHLGPSTDARIEASARQGVVRTQRMALFGGSGRRAARATLGKGQARLTLSTGIGAIEISGPLRGATGH